MSLTFKNSPGDAISANKEKTKGNSPEKSSSDASSSSQNYQEEGNAIVVCDSDSSNDHENLESSQTDISYTVISEWNDPETIIDNDLDFTIDTRPFDGRQSSGAVPLFKRARKSILKQEQKKKPENDANPNRIKSRCFNCDGDHALRECELPRNMKKINKARKARTTKSERYHIDVEQRFAHIKPGKISKTLANALGLKNNEIPSIFYKMRCLKYPPAWLEEARVDHSGITLFGSKGNTVLGSDDDEGELDESKCKYDLTKIISFPGFNSYPGPDYYDDYKYQGVPPYSFADNKEVFITSFKSNAVKQGYKRKKLKFDLEPTEEMVLNDNKDIADMDVDEDDTKPVSQNMQLPLFLLNQPPPPSVTPPSPTIPPPPPPPEEGEIIDEGDELNDSITSSKSTGDDALVNLSLDALQAKQAEILKLLIAAKDGSSGSATSEEIISYRNALIEGSGSATSEEIISYKNALIEGSWSATSEDLISYRNALIEGSGSATSEEIIYSKNAFIEGSRSATSEEIINVKNENKNNINDNVQKTEILSEKKIENESPPKYEKTQKIGENDNLINQSKNIQDNSNNSQSSDLENKSESETKNLFKSSIIGTPLLKFSPYDKLPPGDLFKEGVSDVINFENLPDSTGKYDQMKKLLYKVRQKIYEINENE